jgi:signal transduction histidine kinase
MISIRPHKLFIYAITACIACIPSFGSPAGKNNDWIDEIDSYVNSNPDSAIILCNDAIREHYPLDGSEKVALLTIRGNANFTLGNYDTAKADFRKAADLAFDIADTLAYINALSDLGVAYRVSQQQDSAMACYNHALNMIKDGRFPDMEANILTSLAILFANQGRLKEAIPFAEKGWKRAKLTDDIETQIYAASSLGSALFLAGDHNRGLATQRSIIKIAERKGIPRYILKTYASVIAMHNRLGNTDSVNYYINRGRTLLDKVPEASIESVGFLEQSFVVLTKMGRYKESLDIQMKILNMLDSRPFMPLHLLYQRIALNYKGLGDIERMNDAYIKAIEIADSIHQSDINKQMSDFNARYHAAEKELAIAALRHEKSRRGMIIAILAGVIAATSLLLIIYLRSRRRKTELANIKARIEGIEQERGRLAHELHDGVCNDLLGIELALAGGRNDTAEISEMLRTTRNEVRSISHELLPPSFNRLSLSQLIAAYAYKSDGFVEYLPSQDQIDLDMEQSMNLYRIIQEWIANIRHHGAARYATISLKQSGNETILDICDNGIAFNPDEANSGGLGIDNIRQRVKAINGTIDFTRRNNINIMSVKIFK